MALKILKRDRALEVHVNEDFLNEEFLDDSEKAEREFACITKHRNRVTFQKFTLHEPEYFVVA